MSDQTTPTGAAGPDPAVPVAPKPTQVSVDDLKQYALQLGKWLMFVIVATIGVALTAWVASKVGVQLPGFTPPPPLIVEAPKDNPPPTLAEEAPPPDTLHFCGLHLNLIEKLQAKPWPNRIIKWSIDTSEYSGRLSRAEIVEAFDIAWKAWAHDLDILPTYVEAESQADVRSRFGTVFQDDGTPDGPGSILAWSELSDGTGRPRRQMYDRREAWTISSNPGQAVIDLVRVACHEIGHALGLGHTSGPIGSNLMDPMYNRSIQFPMGGDINRALALGYPARTKGSDPSPTIKIEALVETGKLVELLRKAGYKVELPKK